MTSWVANKLRDFVCLFEECGAFQVQLDLFSRNKDIYNYEIQEEFVQCMDGFKMRVINGDFGLNPRVC